MVATGVYLLVFGGFSESPATGKVAYHNDLHVFDLLEESWLAVNGSGVQPCPRSGFLFWASADGSAAFCCGGTDSKGRKLSDFWRLDLLAMTWKELPAGGGGTAPLAPRSGTTPLGSLPGDGILTFGGVTDEMAARHREEHPAAAGAKKKKEEKTVSVFHGDVRVLSPQGAEPWQSLAPPASAPPGRMHAGGVVLAGQAVICGGICEAGAGGLQEVTLDDVWITSMPEDPVQLTGGGQPLAWRCVQGPSAQVGHFMDGESSSGEDGEEEGEEEDDEED